MTRSELIAAIHTRQSFLCVGLDPELSKLPPHLGNSPEAVRVFNRAVIDATRDLCVAYKPNLAFFEALGPEGWTILQDTIQYIGPNHLVIADAKRGDIGNTGRLYAQAFFERLGAGAVTIAPYMGEDSVRPFLEFPGKWAVLLALTSNPGSADFQLTPQADTGELLYEKVLRKAAGWGSPNQLMFVVGATHPEAFRQVRSIVPDHFLLVPGVGAQGGDLTEICRNGLNTDIGLLINASRSILYASDGIHYAEAARQEAGRLQKAMEHILKAGSPS